jgi:cell division protein FtsW
MIRLRLPDFSTPKAQTVVIPRSQVRDYDAALIGVVACLLMLGLVMVYSASIALPDSRKFARIDHTFFLVRQALYIGLGLIVALLVFSQPMERHQKLAMPLFAFSLVLLIAVLIPGIGREVNGAWRWLPVGPVNLQPTEVMKIAALMYAADYTVRKQDVMQQFRRGFLPMAAAMALVSILVLVQPDLGALTVILSIAAGILFLGGIRLRVFAALSVVLAVLFTSLVLFEPWRRARFFAYLDPWAEGNALGKAYQLSHSLIAFGRGEWFGVGLGASVEKLHYLPEAHTDFIMAVLGEELGFVGVALVICLFFFLVRRCFEIGRQAVAMERPFAGLVAQGIGIWMGVQTFINMGVYLGLLPTKGLTLPFMSYGGSGILANLAAVGLLLRIDYENRLLSRGVRP